MKKCFNNKKIFKSVIGVLLILLFCSAIVDYAFMLKNSNQSKTEEQLKEIGEQLATSIEIHLQDMLVTVKTLARAYSIQYNEDLHQEDALYLLKESISNTNFERIWLTKIEGEAISSDGLTIDASQREYIEYAREGKSGYFLIEKSLVTESEKLLIYSPIYQEDLVIGILIGIYPLEYLNQIIDISCFGGNGLIEILKEDTGECIATNENVLQEESIQKVDGKDYTYETGIDNTGLRLVVTRPYKLFYEESRNLFLLSLLFYVKITIVVGTLIFDRYLSKNQELRHLADSDSMTNLFNRGKIEDEIQLVLKKQLINRAAFILFDVDKFKLVNDTLGHIAGDELIKMIAARMHKEFRKGDLLGRLGGDEFVIFLSEVTDDAVLRNKMNYFSECVSEIGEMMHWPIDVSISYGIACYPENGQSFESLYQYADELMYIQKSEKS